MRRLLSSSSRALSVRGWQPTGGSKMALSCVVHYISAELSDGLVHLFEVQRKGHGLALTSHTLQTAAPVARVRENSGIGSKGLTSIRVMSFNIWNYNGNWMARARMIADVIEASGAGIGVNRRSVVWGGWGGARCPAVMAFIACVLARDRPHFFPLVCMR